MTWYDGNTKRQMMSREGTQELWPAGMGEGTYHPFDPFEVFLEVLIPVAIAIRDGDAAVVRAQQCRHAEWQAPCQLGLQ